MSLPAIEGDSIRSPCVRPDARRSNTLIEHRNNPKTGFHFSVRCSRAGDDFLATHIGQPRAHSASRRSRSLGSRLIDRLLGQGGEVPLRRRSLHVDQAEYRPPARSLGFDLCAATSASRSMSRSTRSTISPVRLADPLPARSVQTTKTSVHGAINMLGLAKRLRCRILQASTSEVYGDPDAPAERGILGQHQPGRPARLLRRRQARGRTLFFDYHRQARPCRSRSRASSTPTVRACTARTAAWFPTIVQALLDQPITIYGDGRQTRSFCYVDDLIDGLIGLMASPPRSPVRSTSATRANSQCWSSPPW